GLEKAETKKVPRDPYVRAVEALGQARKALELRDPTRAALHDLLKSKDAEVRRLAAQLLERLAQPVDPKLGGRTGLQPKYGPRTPVTPSPARGTLEQRLERLLHELQQLRQEIQQQKK